MLILISAAPTAYALNRAMPETAMPVLSDPRVYGALAVFSQDITGAVEGCQSLNAIPVAQVPNVCTDMYLVSDAIRALNQSSDFSGVEAGHLKRFMGPLNARTRFIPTWVKIAVAAVLGIGTMIGWKRIVVTVGEKIGKTHLNYAQGASAEIVAMGTIGLAEGFGMPVSTTHILSSEVAGTMTAAGSGLQWRMLRTMAMEWVVTLPAAMLISGVLFFFLRHIF